MATTKVNSEFIAVNAISGTIIADGAITSTHLAANCVDSSELVTGSIDTIHIAANQVTATKIVTNGVLTRHISNDQVTADKLANSINTDIATGPAALPKTGGTLTGDLILGDNIVAKFGTGNDLQIYHDGTNSSIQNATGDLFIYGGTDHIRIRAKNDEESIVATPNGAVELYHNGSKKIETEAGGVHITGYADADNFKIAGAQGSDGQVLTSTGSGVAWEDASGTTINNNANNRIITGSGTSNTLEGESTFTYDGTSLSVGGTGAITLPGGTTAQRPGSPAAGMIRYNSTIVGIEEYRDGQWKNLSNTFSASGGTITTSGSYTYHTFTSSGSCVFTSSGSIDVLVVAGGGGGGDNSNVRASGGGAGGLIFISSYPVVAATYTASVGSGGAEGASGTNSVFSYSGGTTLTALGGGMGGYNDSTDNGANGGSGGGNWYPGYAGASGTQPTNTNDGSNTYNSTGFGNDGGASGAAQPYGSGGGGAGGAGYAFNAASNNGEGGPGKDMSATFGTSVGESGFFAGGGGTGSYPPQGDTKYNGGNGGGGRGWNNGTETEQNGTANTGGGGGAGGSGGSGIVILRYLT